MKGTIEDKGGKIVEMSNSKNIADGMEKAVETVPQIYDDALKPSVSNMGKIAGLIPQAIYAALEPLRKWIAQKEYNVAETEKLLALKLENVKPEEVVTPENYVGVPAIQAISYCVDSNELREMYANLLAKSMVKSTKEEVHPSFVEIIKQLTPDEAKLLKVFPVSGLPLPLVSVVYKEKSTGHFGEVIHNFTDIAERVCDNPKNITVYIDNLERLKLIEIPFGLFVCTEGAYEKLEKHPMIENVMKSSPAEGCEFEIEKKQMRLSQLGKKFVNVCINDFNNNNDINEDIKQKS